MAAEMCLMQLPHLLANPAAEFKPSSFFSEQLTAFDLWLAHGAQDKKPPEQLPIVLQVRILCSMVIPFWHVKRATRSSCCLTPRNLVFGCERRALLLSRGCTDEWSWARIC